MQTGLVILMALGLAWALTRLAGGACARMANRCDTEMCGCVPRSHFDTFIWSMTTIFQILTGDEEAVVDHPQQL